MGIQSIRYRASIVALVVVFTFSAFGPVAAQGRPGGPGAGGQCLLLGDDGTTLKEGTAQIVLDPGHGGSDTGAINETADPDLIERDLNLDIAYRAMWALQAAPYNYTVALTRYRNDIYLENSERGAIANACGASVFVEIHLNGSSQSSVNYSQTFWGKRRKDEAFAIHMGRALEANLASVPTNGTWQFANGGLLHAEMESTLVEAVFLTNDLEAELFVSSDRDREGEIAYAIAQGILTWPEL